MGKRPKKKRLAMGLVIDGLHPSGTAFGRFEGRRVFVEDAIPGETADVRVIYGGNDFLTGERIQTLSPHPQRKTPFCRHSGVCGGCKWQHIQYMHQLEMKRSLLSEVLSRKAIPSPQPEPVIASPETLRYRNRLEFAFSDTRWFYNHEGKIEDTNERLALGFHAAGVQGRVVDTEECYLAPEAFIQIRDFVKKEAVAQGLSFFSFKNGTGQLRNLEIRCGSRSGWTVILGLSSPAGPGVTTLLRALRTEFPFITSVLINLLRDAYKGIPSTEYLAPDGDTGHTTEEANGLVFRVSAGSFYQPNRFQAPELFRLVQEMADAGPNDHVYDLYTGAGTLALHLARKAGQVTGIEASEDAIRDAKYNAMQNQIDNCNFIQGDVLQTLTQDFILRNGKPDIVVLDPPRSGTLIEIKKRILESQPRKIIYVSCDPSSLANDLKMLTQDYNIRRIQPVDMFPYTAHIETLVEMERK